MRNWFTSDTHFSHANVIKYCNRPFADIDIMNKTIIERWNERVNNEDTVYMLGDYGFKRSSEAPEGRGADMFQYYRKQLNGNIIFVAGNHDNNNMCKTILQSCVIKYGGKFIKLMHNPTWAEAKYDFNFCGHVHNEFKFKRLISEGNISTIVNVGVDVWDFRPISYEEIISAYSKWIRQQKKENNEQIK